MNIPTTTKYSTFINSDRVEITKQYRTKTQYEYFLTIFMVDSQFESIRNYQDCHLTKKSAIEEAFRVINSPAQPRIERVTFYNE